MLAKNLIWKFSFLHLGVLGGTLWLNDALAPYGFYVLVPAPLIVFCALFLEGTLGLYTLIGYGLAFEAGLPTPFGGMAILCTLLYSLVLSLKNHLSLNTARHLFILIIMLHILFFLGFWGCLGVFRLTVSGARIRVLQDFLISLLFNFPLTFFLSRFYLKIGGRAYEVKYPVLHRLGLTR